VFTSYQVTVWILDIFSRATVIIMFAIRSSSAMYKQAQKLPVWQQTPSPTYRRSSLSRHFRVFIMIAICFLVWHRYSKSSVLERSRESIIDSSIALSYSAQRERLVQRPAVERQEKEIEQKRELSSTQLLAETLDEEENTDSSPGVVLVDKVQEQLDKEDTAVHQPARESKKISEFKAGSEPQKLYKPPPLVKQASQKLIDQHLSPAVKDEPEKKPKNAEAIPSEPSGAAWRFPPYSEYAGLNEKAEALPDIIHMPFEDTTTDVILEGWEDQWFTNAEFNVEKWGKINETKIDFVYTCKSPLMISFWSAIAHFWRGQWLRHGFPRDDLSIRG